MARPKLWPLNFRAERSMIDLSIATCAVTDRNFPDELRAFMAWWTRQPGAKLPARPTTEQLAEGAAKLAAKTEQAA